MEVASWVMTGLSLTWKKAVGSLPGSPDDPGEDGKVRGCDPGVPGDLSVEA